jgi:23S rRNA (cytosine1962-C5)-methyltransferase
MVDEGSGTLKALSLQARGEERVLRGHPWVFSNQVRGDLKTYARGEMVEVRSSHGVFIGVGYANPNSLIAARILTRQKEEVNGAFLRRRLERAREVRERFMPGSTAHRWVFSEADGLPGFIVDRYGDCLVVELLTAGADALGESFREALLATFEARAIVLRNDSAMRVLEGLPQETSVWHGELDAPVEIEQGGLRLKVDLLKGQKTGFYFDQRENRAYLASLKPAGRILDCFCYSGAWSLSLARAVEGVEVLALDESRSAVELARENAALNGLDRYVRFESAEVFQALEALAGEKRRFDCVVLDPPAMVKSRARIMEGYRGYRRLHRLAARVVAKRGLLATACCSYHMSLEQFAEAVADGLARSERTARVIHVGGQASDHPVHPAVPESNYLKFMLLELD